MSEHQSDQIFWDRVKKTPGGCWEWTGSINQHGYARVNRQNKNWTASRWAWVLSVGPIPIGKQVLHHCDNRRCVNPDHLWLGTHRDNMADMVAKQRKPRRLSAVIPPPITPTVHRAQGSEHGSAKLDEQTVRLIREQFAAGKTQRFLANAFGVSQRSIWAIANRRTWRHV